MPNDSGRVCDCADMLERYLTGWHESVKAIAAVLLATGLAAGIGLRTLALGRVPLGFNQDEACNGYDAYCLLKTGADQHGNRFPIVIQGFNDYRMPLFDYSLVPLIGVFGPTPMAVRLGAAVWGVTDLFGIAVLGWLMFGLRGAAAVAVLGALSPWHLCLSRFGVETISASATVTLGIVAFWLAIRRNNGRFLLISAVFFGLSLYAYRITTVFTPLMMMWLGVVHRRELRSMMPAALLGMLHFGVFALPLAWLTLRSSVQMQARFNSISIFNKGLSGPGVAKTIAANFASEIGPNFLFLEGNWFDRRRPSDFLFLRGNWLDRRRPSSPAFGQLLRVQAPLILLGLLSLATSRYRNTGMFLLGWLVIAAVPGALLVPAPHALHAAMAIAPWTLFSALGILVVLDCPPLGQRLRMIIAAVLLALAVVEGSRFTTFYFRGHVSLVGRDFHYGFAEAVREAMRSAAPGEPIVITSDMNLPYIYVLFFGPYPPQLFQREPVMQGSALFAPVTRFDRYLFESPREAFARLPHGVFVFSASDAAPVAPCLEIRDPGGNIAYRIFKK